ncbi:MAG: hypothetical protein ACREJN_08220, partial [Nitrospiraceae bacterium]
YIPAMRIDLQIAGYRLRLTETLDVPCIGWPLHPFGAFLDLSGHQPDIEITVIIVEELPNLSHGSLHFDACHGLWRLYDTAGGLLLESLDTRTHQPCARALIAENYSKVRVWTCGELSDSVLGWVPMKIINPIVEVCLLTRVAREGGLLLHSAGILSPSGGYIFTGASGVGKSTLSGFFAERGASVLSDERTIIRGNGGDFVMHGTPWIGSGAYAKNEAGLLTELFCISHGNVHQIKHMAPGAVLAWVFPQCFLPHWDRAAMESTLEFLDDVILRVPCRSLAFAKDPSVVEYIQSGCATSTAVAS